jgi:hypothetical protein
MAEGADHRHTRLLAQLLDSVGASGVDTQNRQNSDDVYALSSYCGSHDICLDPVKKMLFLTDKVSVGRDCHDGGTIEIECFYRFCGA